MCLRSNYSVSDGLAELCCDGGVNLCSDCVFSDQTPKHYYVKSFGGSASNASPAEKVRDYNQSGRK